MNDDEILTETVCRECGKNQEKETNFCPKCGEEKPDMDLVLQRNQ